MCATLFSCQGLLNLLFAEHVQFSHQADSAGLWQCIGYCHGKDGTTNSCTGFPLVRCSLGNVIQVTGTDFDKHVCQFPTQHNVRGKVCCNFLKAVKSIQFFEKKFSDH